MATNILTEILAHKRTETAARMKETPLKEIKKRAKEQKAVRPFAAALRNAVANGRHPVIAEIKRKSPSKGVLCNNFKVADIAKGYECGGAACLSVLTDEKYFGGNEKDLRAAQAECGLPVLRKDFILLGHGEDNWKITEWQLYESRAIGADAVLLIVNAFQQDKKYGYMEDGYEGAFNKFLGRYIDLASELEMTTLIEIHSQQELDMVLDSLLMVSEKKPMHGKQILIGVNNRNLETFKTDIKTTINLSEKIKEYISESKKNNKGEHDAHFNPLFISESGIHSNEDIKTLKNAGTDAFLIGESLVNNPKEGLRRLFGG